MFKIGPAISAINSEGIIHMRNFRSDFLAEGRFVSIFMNGNIRAMCENVIKDSMAMKAPIIALTVWPRFKLKLIKIMLRKSIKKTRVKIQMTQINGELNIQWKLRWSSRNSSISFVLADIQSFSLPDTLIRLIPNSSLVNQNSISLLVM